MTIPWSMVANFVNALGDSPMLNSGHVGQRSTIAAVRVVPLSTTDPAYGQTAA